MAPFARASSPTPGGALLKRAPYLETEEQAAQQPHRTYYYRQNHGEAGCEASIARCTAELASASGEVARALRRERAGYHARAGSYDAALADYSAALELSVGDLDRDGASAGLHQARGEVLEKLGRTGEAIDDFTRCLGEAPNRASALYARASCRNKLGDFASAIDDYQRALALDEARDPKGALGEKRPSLALGADAYAAARERALREAMAEETPEKPPSPERPSPKPSPKKRSPSDASRSRRAAEAHQRGVALRRSGDLLSPKHFRARFDRAFALDALGDLPRAVLDYTAAIAIDASHALAWYNRGIAHERLRDAEAAVLDFTKAIEHALAREAGAAKTGAAAKDRFPVADFYHNRAFCKRKLADFSGAVDDYAAALAKDPKHFKALYNRAFCLDALGRRAEALKDYEAALALRPAHASAHHNRGVVLEKLGELEAALRAFDTAIQLVGDGADKAPPPPGRRPRADSPTADDSQCLGAALYARALVLDRLKRLDDAAESFDRAVAIRPDDAEYHHARGANARHRGLHAKANKRALLLELSREQKMQRDLILAMTLMSIKQDPPFLVKKVIRLLRTAGWRVINKHWHEAIQYCIQQGSIRASLRDNGLAFEVFWPK
ncbi:protein N-acetylglucosaminyltransferase [Aureococcus anophagefferens]|uniref:Protein N-acetylglucosaminyltransferase n=1 Tax=Aureococcus anophagefferens TaxID=44056 RepID=A0ABR1FZF0_AURAN